MSTILALEVAGLSLSFGGLKVLQDVEFTLATSEALGIVGPNGSGKTSLLNCVSGLFRNQEGTVRVLNTSTAGLRAHQIARLGVGRTFQNVEVFRDFTVLELAMLGRDVLTKRTGVLAYMSGIPYLNGRERGERDYALRTLDLLGIRAYAQTRLGNLPYGIAKLADLARVIAMEPHILLLDEPASGLEGAERTHLLATLGRVRQETGLAIALIEHDLDLVAGFCDRLLVLSEGRRRFLGEMSVGLDDPEVQRVVFGEISGGGRADGGGDPPSSVARDSSGTRRHP